MALDTAQKRRSMVSFGGALYGERVPEATNFDAEDDRAAALFLYSFFGVTLPADYYSPRNPTVTIAPSIRCTVTVRPSLSVTPTITP